MNYNKKLSYKRLEHSKKRAFERYNLILNKRTRIELSKLATKKNLIEQKDKFNIYLVEYNNIDIKFVYSNRKKEFITFLPYRIINNIQEIM